MTEPTSTYVLLNLLFNPFLPHTINAIAIGVWAFVIGLVYLGIKEHKE